MNLKEGISRLSQLFMSANACMEKEDYHAAINEYKKIIELVQILRKPFDNGEVPLNVINEVFPKILQAEQTAKDGIFTATFGIEAQKKLANNQSSANISQSRNDTVNSLSISIDDVNNPDVKQFIQHIQSAGDYIENGDYNSAIDEYNKALDRLRILQWLIIKQADNYSPSLVVETLEKAHNAEIDIHKGLFAAYVKIGNLEKATEEQRAIDTLSNSSDSAKNSPPQIPTQSNTQAGGCFSTIFVMFLIVSTLIFVW